MEDIILRWWWKKIISVEIVPALFFPNRPEIFKFINTSFIYLLFIFEEEGATCFVLQERHVSNHNYTRINIVTSYTHHTW